ncbi:phytoene dehydrogenase [Geomicrobium sp. JCM 19037]|uniref:phytoene desaturase family protein n=1 Tax=Geomicrobium sp. JCM 19037 TaxID=1460634 RepID=UPI00045F1C29|nr:FAD-dependent oxidoreductase [Geomicrobium sp. JCM 19037]GAK01888.1 phytoene dehydrogenase [Geomicrobium sp. JCM 19037]
MNKKSVIVIGAGVAGLASAIRLQHAGYQVDLYEKESTPGGKMNVIKQDGYQFDLGPSIVMMPELYREVFELAGKDLMTTYRWSRLIHCIQYFSVKKRMTITKCLQTSSN